MASGWSNKQFRLIPEFFFSFFFFVSPSQFQSGGMRRRFSFWLFIQYAFNTKWRRLTQSFMTFLHRGARVLLLFNYSKWKAMRKSNRKLIEKVNFSGIHEKKNVSPLHHLFFKLLFWRGEQTSGAILPGGPKYTDVENVWSCGNTHTDGNYLWRHWLTPFRRSSMTSG